MMFRRFVGMSIDASAWHAGIHQTSPPADAVEPAWNRYRLLKSNMKSFRSKDGSGEALAIERSGEVACCFLHLGAERAGLGSAFLPR